MRNDERSRLVLLNRITFLLSLLGIFVAAYVLQSWLRQTSIICPTGGCETVRKSVYSYPLGVPVPAIGLVGYFILTVLSFLRTTTRAGWVLKSMLGMIIFGVCFVSWFTYTEIFVIKGICTWCAVSALNMYVIFGLVLTQLRQEKTTK